MARVSFRSFLAGEDGPGRRALPAGEFLHPVPVLATIALLVNDWFAKGSAALPTWLSGKLSDVAGLLAGPLAATAALDCALWLAARLGFRVDFSLRRGRLYGAALACGAAFSAVKLWPAAAGALERASGWMDWQVVSDPSDLLALPALAVSVWLGRRQIARVPLGRIEVLERRWRRSGEPPAVGLADVVECGGDPALVGELAAGLERFFAGGPPEAAESALARLRASRRPSPNTPG